MSRLKLASALAAGLAVVIVTGVLGFVEPRLAPAAVATAVMGATGTVLLYGRQQQRQLPRLERRIGRRIGRRTEHLEQRIEHLEQRTEQRSEHLEQRLEQRMDGLADEHARIRDDIATVREECNSVEVLRALDELRTQVVDVLHAAGEDESDRLVTAFDLLAARIARLEHALDERLTDLPHPVP